MTTITITGNTLYIPGQQQIDQCWLDRQQNVLSAAAAAALAPYVEANAQHALDLAEDDERPWSAGPYRFELDGESANVRGACYCRAATSTELLEMLRKVTGV